MVASSVATSQSTLFQLTHTRRHKRQHKRQHERPDVTRGAAPALEGGLVCSLVSDSDLSVRVCGKCGTRVRIGYLSGELRGSEIEGGTTTLNSFSVSQLRIAKARAVRSLRRVRLPHDRSRGDWEMMSLRIYVRSFASRRNGHAALSSTDTAARGKPGRR